MLMSSLPDLVVVVWLCDFSDFVSASGSEAAESTKKTCERHVTGSLGMCSCCDFETKSRAAKRKVITSSTLGG